MQPEKRNFREEILRTKPSYIENLSQQMLVYIFKPSTVKQKHSSQLWAQRLRAGVAVSVVQVVPPSQRDRSTLP